MKTLLTLLGLLPIMATAQSLSSEQAQQQAYDFFRSHVPAGAHHAPAAVSPVLAYTAQTEGTPDFYVFNRSAEAPGFVIINSDASAPQPILGYGDNAAFDYEAIPDNLRWWLSQYQQNGVAKLSASREEVRPIVTSQWNQDEPFNNAIPRLSATSAPFVTGCVATAMSQIMYAHKWPLKGSGSNTFQCGSWRLSNGQIVTPTFSANFGATNYDWDNMIDVYSRGHYTQEQADAVATLMYHAGVSVNMEYGQSSSGANDRDAAVALIQNFCYGKDMHRAERDYYTDRQWEDIIYTEVAEGRPVYYSGASTKGGHAFVLDGYLGGLYHINWGWGGFCDSYFALTGSDALMPEGSGTGGAGVGAAYTQRQAINYNIHPETGRTEYLPQVICHDGFRVSTNSRLDSGTLRSSYDIDRSVHGTAGDVTLYYSYANYNGGLCDVSFSYGIGMRNSITGELYVDEASVKHKNLRIGYFDQESSSNFSSFSTSIAPYNGVYEIVPVYSVDQDSWQVMPTKPSVVIPTVTITGGEDAVPVEVPFTLTDNQIEVTKTARLAPNSFYAGAVTYTSSDEAVATVDAEGVITGRSVGTVTITATAEGDAHFLPTIVSYTITVVDHIMYDVVFALSTPTLMLGKTAEITVDPSAYDGNVTYTVAPEGIVSVSPEGIITALAEGEAIVTVTAEGTEDYRPATQNFTVTVVTSLPLTNGLCFESYPVVGNQNIVTTSDYTLTLPLINNGNSVLSNTPCVVRYKIGNTTSKHTYTFSGKSPGDSFITTIDLPQSALPLLGHCNTCVIEFFSDTSCKTPMNVPSITFLYLDQDPRFNDLPSLIEQAKANPPKGITSQLIRTFVNKLLKR